MCTVCNYVLHNYVCRTWDVGVEISRISMKLGVWLLESYEVLSHWKFLKCGLEKVTRIRKKPRFSNLGSWVLSLVLGKFFKESYLEYLYKMIHDIFRKLQMYLSNTSLLLSTNYQLHLTQLLYQLPCEYTPLFRILITSVLVINLQITNFVMVVWFCWLVINSVSEVTLSFTYISLSVNSRTLARFLLAVQ